MADEMLISNSTFYVLKRKLPESGKVVCVHGIGSNHQNFDKLSLNLEESGFSILTYDFMGRG